MSYHEYKFREFLVEMVQMSLKVKVNHPYFQYHAKVYYDAYLV